MLVKAVLYDREELLKGESCYARLKLKEPLPCKRGDRFVVRFYSPLETIGGGTILDSSPGKRIARGSAALDSLIIREQGNAADITRLAAFELGRVFTEADLCRRSDLDVKTCRDTIGALIDNQSILKLSPGKYISAGTLSALSGKCARLLASYHKAQPLRSGMNIAELRQKLLPDTDIAEATAVLNKLRDGGAITLSDKDAALPGFSIELTGAQSRIREKLMDVFTASGYDAPSPDELVTMFQKGEKGDFEQVMENIKSSGELVVLSPQVFWHKSAFSKAVGQIRGHFSANEEITLAQCRDMLGTSRRNALVFLEYLDRIQATRKLGDARKLAKGQAGLPRMGE
jgi:selenocysteine-specific elongation factor